jgi:sarcosine oxidase
MARTVGVVGLGLVGSAALRHLAGQGFEVVGIGVAEPSVLSSHSGPFGSHYDSGRVTRHLDPSREWAMLAETAIARYRHLEERSGIRFHFPTGMVLAERDPVRVAQVRAVASELAVAHTEGDLDARVDLVPGHTVFFEPGPAGFIDPRRMLSAQLGVAASDGARIVLDEVIGLEFGNLVQILTREHGAVVVDQVVLAAGPHTDEIAGAPPLPRFDVRSETVVLAHLDQDERERLRGLPAVLAEVDDEVFADVYLVPPTLYPDGTVRLKMGASRRVPVRLETATERRLWMRGDAHRDDLPGLRRLVEALIPRLSARSFETRPCLITDTLTGLPHIDRLDERTVLAAGGNGYAGKSADAIGSLAAGLVAGEWGDERLSPALFAAGAA